MSPTICRTISRSKCIAGLFCALILGLSPNTFGQLALPPLYTLNERKIILPFEVGPAANFRELELLVSQDRGRRWQFVERRPIEAGEFSFLADADGEYWFAFRRVYTSGNQPQFNGHPQARVLVDTTVPMVDVPSLSNETSPVTPPRPERFPIGSRAGLLVAQPTQPQPVQSEWAEQPEQRMRSPLPMLPTQASQVVQTAQSEGGTASEPTSVMEGRIAERVVAEPPRQSFGPRLPGFDPAEAVRNQGDLLGDLLSGMRPFLDVQPAVRRAVPNDPVAMPMPLTAMPALPAISPSPLSPLSEIPAPSGEMPAGRITDVRLDPSEDDPRQRLVVLWHPGQESWRDAQVDILRGDSREGPWTTIALSLPNNGEYWWFITPADLRPFYVAVRIRNSTGVHINPSLSAIVIPQR